MTNRDIVDEAAGRVVALHQKRKDSSRAVWLARSRAGLLSSRTLLELLQDAVEESADQTVYLETLRDRVANLESQNAMLKVWIDELGTEPGEAELGEDSYSCGGGCGGLVRYPRASCSACARE